MWLDVQLLHGNVFADGGERPFAFAEYQKLKSARRTVVPFDRALLGQELATFNAQRTDREDVRLRSLRIGVAQDPMGVWAAEYGVWRPWRPGRDRWPSVPI